jgi:hypothetical protein
MAALKQLRKRSKLTATVGEFIESVRRALKGPEDGPFESPRWRLLGSGPFLGEWQEYVDPVTNSQWFLDASTWRTTWSRPVEIQLSLRRREVAFDEQRAMEKDLLLEVEFKETEWHAAFHVAADPVSALLDDLAPADPEASHARPEADVDRKRQFALLAVAGRSRHNGEPGEPLDASKHAGRTPAKAAALPQSSFASTLSHTRRRSIQDEGASQPVGADRLEACISKIYPKRNGFTEKTLKSGLKTTGTVKDGVFEGEARCVYANGDVYMGEWVAGMRSGEGIYTSTTDGKRCVSSR